ncbi:MAG: TraB/GumN family protein [Haloarculaceae archaeon]
MTERVESAVGTPPEPSGEGTVEVVGTAHVSSESVDRVEREIRERRPDVVAVELDEGRYRQLKGETPDDLDASDLLRGNTVFQFLAYWMLSYVQTRLGDRFDIEPGADMLAAVETAEQLGLGVALVDRDIQQTIRRFWKRMTLWEKLKMLGSLILAMGGFVGDEEVDELDVESLTEADVVTAMMEEFRRFSPGGAAALIDERDAFIAHRLVALREAGYDVVAVVGAGHREGIETYLERPEELPPLSSLVGEPSTRRIGPYVYKAVGYAITLGFLVFFVLLALGGAQKTWLLNLFAWWFAVNAVLAGGLAKLGGARWPSALVGGGIAWLTSVNPLLAPGWFAGYVELRYVDVNVSDIATLNEILTDEEAPIRELLARLRAVPLFRLIVIVALTNVGSMLASLVVFPALLPTISAPIGGVDQMGQLLIDGARTGASVLVGVVT